MKKFKIGDVVVFEPKNINQEWWEKQTEEDLLKWYSELGYGQEKKKLFVYLTEINDCDGDSSGHCVLVSLDDQKVITMRHTSDFRKATEEEY